MSGFFNEFCQGHSPVTRWGPANRLQVRMSSKLVHVLLKLVEYRSGLSSTCLSACGGFTGLPHGWNVAKCIEKGCQRNPCQIYTSVKICEPDTYLLLMVVEHIL